jgi:hypothetical protein
VLQYLADAVMHEQLARTHFSVIGVAQDYSTAFWLNSGWSTTKS